MTINHYVYSEDPNIERLYIGDKFYRKIETELNIVVPSINDLIKFDDKFIKVNNIFKTFDFVNNEINIFYE